MPDGYIEFSVKLDAKEAEGELSRIKKKIRDLEMELAEQKGARSDLEEKLQKAGDAAERAKAKIEELTKQRDRLMGAPGVGDQSAKQIRIQELTGEISAQESIFQGYVKEADAAVAALQKQDDKIADTTRKIENQKLAYGQVQKEALAAGDAGTTAATTSGTAAEVLSKKLDHVVRRVTSLAKRVLVFTLVSRAFRAMREYLGSALQTNEEFTTATARLKGALLSAFQPIYTAALPALTALINVLTSAMRVLASFTSMLFGSTAEASAQSAENLYDEANALDAVGGGAKKASKSLASFDEINQLGGESGGGGGGGSAAAGKKQPDFVGGIKDQMGELEIYIAGALLGLGAILAFSGVNIPLGIALMAVGALGLGSAIAENWEEMPNHIRKALTTVALILGGAAFAIGAILTLSGPQHMGIGIALLAIGALSMASAAALNWNKLSKLLKGTIGAITAVVSTALIAVGAVLAFSGGHLPLGIALMAMGLAGVAATVAANWSTIKNLLQGPLGVITTMVSAALLAVGAILAFSGVALPLGIALMAAGAAGLAPAVAANWDTIITALRGPIGALVGIVGAALLAIGAVLAFSGGNLPLGIALIAAGAVGLAAAIAPNWDTVITALKGPIGAAVAIASSALLGLGLLLAFSGVGLPLGIALIAAGAAGLVTVSKLNWDAILDKLKGAWAAIKAWWTSTVAPIFTVQYWTDKFSTIKDGLRGALNGVIALLESAINWIGSKLNTISIDIPPVFGSSGAHLGFSIPQVSIPRLATGAVIPPNREFLAVLGDQRSGTNIEAPLDTMVQAFRQALREGGGGQRTLVLQVGERELGRIVFDAYNAESTRVGATIGGYV